ncbi:hypothetical protein Nepgr_002043 [Nepenthes gracilis]|uniref:Uncharacterized protein n=1 Tax=Nepenthes gracilis TaxID=150966 RepID=A0AAD3P956_NEPGR|nr:hypothetical protein Nepgr_002043 [Nepenthes gracilis]
MRVRGDIWKILRLHCIPVWNRSQSGEDQGNTRPNPPRPIKEVRKARRIICPLTVLAKYEKYLPFLALRGTKSHGFKWNGECDSVRGQDLSLQRPILELTVRRRRSLPCTGNVAFRPRLRVSRGT